MLRATLIATLIALCSAVAFFAGRGGTPTSSTVIVGEPREVDAEHAAGLDRRIPWLRLDDVPLDKAIIALADAARLNIIVSWEFLKMRSNIERGRLVSFDLRDATAGDVLRAMLPEEVWSLHDGVISVGGDPYTEPRVYDIRDLAEEYARYYYPGYLPADRRSGQMPTTQAYSAALKDYSQMIMSRLTTSGDMDMSEVAGRLIIIATREEHARIRDTLQQLHLDATKRIASTRPAATSS